MMSSVLFGPRTRSLCSLWSECVGESTCVLRPADERRVQKLFHRLNLFPSRSQVFEMIECACECDRHTKSAGQDDDNESRLSFGEFALFAAELRRYYAALDNEDEFKAKLEPSSSPGAHNLDGMAIKRGSRKKKLMLRPQKSSTSVYDVFLGGSCNPTTWRRDVAIPALKSQGLTYFNPQTSDWVPEMIELEHQAKQTSQILFFVLEERTRNVVSMIEASYLAGARRRLVVVIRPYPKPLTINDEPVSDHELSDLNAGLSTVHDLVERQGMPVFESIDVALTCTVKLVREHLNMDELTLDDCVSPVKLAHLPVGDKLVRLREAFDNFATNEHISLDDLGMAFRIHAHRDLDPEDLRQVREAYGIEENDKDASIRPLIDFDHFCAIVAEFKNAQPPSKETVTTAKKDVNDNVTTTSSHQPRVSGHCRRTRRKIGGALMRPFQRFLSSPSRGRQEKSRSNSNTDNAPAGTLVDTLANLEPVVALRSSSDSLTCTIEGENRRGSNIRDVYLGGIVSPSLTPASSPRTTITNGPIFDALHWRELVAIPLLKKHGLTFFNPQSSRKTTLRRSHHRLMPIKTVAMDNSRVLLFVIPEHARALSTMCEAAHYIGLGARMVLCLQKMKPEAADVNNEVSSRGALKDYNRGRAYLSDIANRSGVPVFDDINEAMECVLDKCKATSNNNNTSEGQIAK